jgi:hypothetical protein
MIGIASRATRGVKILNRHQTRDEVIALFKMQMNQLKIQLNVCVFLGRSQDRAPDSLFQSQYVSGRISLTCDAWQASNTDGYFAVTGHWIEELSPGKWTLEHALFGFTRMNTAHNGRRLGQALYKIVNRLGIVRKVSALETTAFLNLLVAGWPHNL